MLSWNVAGFQAEHVTQLSSQELNQLMRSNEKAIIVDVRAKQEFDALHIPGAINIPFPDMRKRHSELPKDSTIALVCGTGMRSSLAASILQRNEFKDVRNVAGGMNGYIAAGYIR
jgi:hydroxyacylglutathione hydrolase